MTTTTQLQNQHSNDSPRTGSCGQEMHDEIAHAAHCAFVKHGSKDGNDVQNWLEAEANVKAKHAHEKHVHEKHTHHERHHAASASSR